MNETPSLSLDTAFQLKDNSFCIFACIKAGKLIAHWESTNLLRGSIHVTRLGLPYTQLNTSSSLRRGSNMLVIHSVLLRKLSMNLKIPRNGIHRIFPMTAAHSLFVFHIARPTKNRATCSSKKLYFLLGNITGL